MQAESRMRPDGDEADAILESQSRSGSDPQSSYTLKCLSICEGKLRCVEEFL